MRLWVIAVWVCRGFEWGIVRARAPNFWGWSGPREWSDWRTEPLHSPTPALFCWNIFGLLEAKSRKILHKLGVKLISKKVLGALPKREKRIMFWGKMKSDPCLNRSVLPAVSFAYRCRGGWAWNFGLSCDVDWDLLCIAHPDLWRRWRKRQSTF